MSHAGQLENSTQIAEFTSNLNPNPIAIKI